MNILNNYALSSITRLKTISYAFSHIGNIFICLIILLKLFDKNKYYVKNKNAKCENYKLSFLQHD